jgi:glycosyltransferase involved in cell wall biosynthesis
MGHLYAGCVRLTTVENLRFLVPANIRHNSGGNVYNARLAQGLKALGIDVEVLPVEGSWPEATDDARRRLGTLLGVGDHPGDFPAGTVTLVDGLIASGSPDELEDAAAAERQTWVLTHMPSTCYSEPEARSLRAATGVICTSSSAAARVSSLYGITASRVALPGTDPAPVAKGEDPPHIVAVAALLPNKDQLLTVEALALIRRHPWTAALVGSDKADPEYAEMVRSAIASHGLEGRVQVTGQLVGQALDDEWDRADLSLLVSQAESFGLVVLESLARAVPVIVRAGTGAVEALTLASGAMGEDNGVAGGHVAHERILPGAAVELSPVELSPAHLSAVEHQAVERGATAPDAASAKLLAEALQKWLEDPNLRAGWREAALATRSRLPGWEGTARSVLEILGQ